METKPLLKVYRILSFIAPLLIVYACMSGSRSVDLKVTITNTMDSPLQDAVITLDDPGLLQKIGDNILVKRGNEVIPFQRIDSNQDGKTDELLILCDLDQGESAQISIGENPGEPLHFKKRTQAELSVKENGTWEKVTKDNGREQYEYKGGSFKNITQLRVPDEHTDHSFYIRYEGPGWESDKVGYRFYLDWRNATDIFGKKVPDMVLQDVGQDDFEAYHELSDWGMDVLKVGNSLGIGSFAYWTGRKAVRVENTDSTVCKILENGDLRSSIETIYYGWKDADTITDLTSLLSIDAGSRLTHVQLAFTQSIDNLCTGIVKHENTEILRGGGEGSEWSYLATFGLQSLNNDNLGMVVFYKTADLTEFTEDEDSYVLVLAPVNNKVDYYFGAIWGPDVDHIDSQEGFSAYLNATLDRLNHPIEINY